MEKSTSILISNAQPNGAEQLPLLQGNVYHFKQNQKESLDNTRLIETEKKLNQVFEEYSARIESFMMMLDTIREGVVVINKAHETCFANERGTQLLTEVSIHKPDCFLYRELITEENFSITLNSDYYAGIRANNFFWNNEPCTIFVIDKKALVKTEAASVIQPSTSSANPYADLMNSVRQIAGYEASGKTLDASTTADAVGKSLLQTEKLLGDIKTFIGLVNYQPVIAPVSMQKLVGDILKGMGPEIEDAEVEVSVSDLPDTKGDKELISKLIKHLVYNALKFRNKSRKAVIDIGHDQSDGQYIFCVRDNGIGISKKHHEQVFDLYSTLNNNDEYPGNGMGLAISKKIVELHDGKIWVESLPGHGSNFYFKLNAK